MRDDYAKNLVCLCEAVPSIAELCRTLDINRQQFARYLSGQNRPSRFNERKIRDHFGLSNNDLHLSHADFRSYHASFGSNQKQASDPVLRTISEALSGDPKQLRPYLGYYHIYFYAFGWDNMILKGLSCLYEQDGRILSKTVERLRDPVSGHRFVFKYQGIVTMKADRLFIVDSDDLAGEELDMTILYRTYRNHTTLLSGLTMGSSSRTKRDPSATRIVYSFIGKTVDYRVALRACGLFHPNSHNIPAHIKPLVVNHLPNDHSVLFARTIE